MHQVNCMLIAGDTGNSLCDLGYAISGVSVGASLIVGTLTVDTNSNKALKFKYIY